MRGLVGACGRPGGLGGAGGGFGGALRGLGGLGGLGGAWGYRQSDSSPIRKTQRPVWSERIKQTATESERAATRKLWFTVYLELGV